MRSKLQLEDFLYRIPEVISKWLDDREFLEDFDEGGQNWIYFTREKNGLIKFIVNKGNKKAENSVYLSSGPDMINITNDLSETQRQRVERLLRLTIEDEYVDYCVAKVKYMKEHHKFKRLENDERFSSLVNVTNSFIEVENILSSVENEERILELFDFDPLRKLEDLKSEIEERSFVPEFKNKT